MRVTRNWLRPVLEFALVGALAGCSCGLSSNATGDASSLSSQMCDRLDMPRDALHDEGVTVEQLLTMEGKDGVGLRAMFALLQPGRATDAKPFRPVLGYLSNRWQVESYDGKVPPDPSGHVVANARKLDRFLADGGCG